MSAAERGTAGSTPVFAWLLGQDDNVGDSLLRRGYADALRTRGPLVAYVGWNGPDYVAGLDLQAGDRVEHRYRAWLVALLRASRTGGVTVAINSGEFALSRLYALYAATLVPALRVVRRRGGTVLWLGAAVPAPAPAALRPVFRALFARCDLVRWRDDQSSSTFESAPWMPDWGFAFGGAQGSADRDRLVVSLRGDRPYPPEEWLDAVRSLAAATGLEVVAVAQVQRDSATASRLARDLAGRAVVFDGGSHLEHETLVRGEYARTSVVLSDRLHALIVAATEGAVPLAWCPSATSKIDRHLRPVGMAFATVPRGSETASLRDLDGDAIEGMRRMTVSACAAAATELEAVGSEIRTLGRGTR